ncbi:hypothetical protein KIN20_007418 [Parelaphostrongylus tenuis]|uniref:Uncharacterized protein n=1 Tax=Parelaphostrongylus tenuis TaxID=148309 RepID=A0AAD5M3E2_PARTN|nr:hypothetical protein KIN20_007418 [Parelaphostrongylus tenuis]
MEDLEKNYYDSAMTIAVFCDDISSSVMSPHKNRIHRIFPGYICFRYLMTT